MPALMNAKITAAKNPLNELMAGLGKFAERCRSARWFGPLFWVGVNQDVAKEIEKHHRQIAADAYAAEQADLQAAKLLEDAAKDGLNQCDLPAVIQAIRHIRNSAKRDHLIASSL